ncbi:hypothetical protein [Devosia nitrariae]|uniref:hypothetical protein n=1 Tax=Devosia nitrariae TaxID=2071872 RepID=UPI0024E05CC9|nr:hypothetical protein [Devosia nitrariae]
MFGKPSILKEYAGLARQLEEGERRPPQHERPRSVTDKGFASFATSGVQAVFEAFEYFGTLMNRQVSDPWTIEETSDTLVKDIRSDSPELGRTYRVYYNGVRMGRLQVTEGVTADGLGKDIEWHREHRSAYVILELDNLRFVPYDDVLSMVSTVELLVGVFDDNDLARARAKSSAAAALTGYLWEVMRAGDEYVPPFEHRVDGPYDLLKITTDHWKERGIDPFERWDGDRSL